MSEQQRLIVRTMTAFIERGYLWHTTLHDIDLEAMADEIVDALYPTASSEGTET